jgi:hypothetical protein
MKGSESDGKLVDYLDNGKDQASGTTEKAETRRFLYRKARREE